jgi:hypothetical protein
MMVGQSTSLDGITHPKLRSIFFTSMRLTTDREITSSMDQCTTVLYLRMKGLSTEAIHQDLVATLGPEAVAYSIVMWYRGTLEFVGQNEWAYDEAELTWTDLVDEAIMKAVGDNPFSSVHQLSRLTCLSRSTVH